MDWHQVRWEQNVANNPEFLAVQSGKPEALAEVYDHARTQGDELAELAEPGAEVLEVRRKDGVLYATIEPVRYAEPTAASLARMTTLLSGVCAEDEISLLKRLARLPAWEIETREADELS